ncbi:hypothetical protein MIND_01333100 [Mycena indigotica]|uniref:Uncharacterized protein n=1 Tax=Mycena indigotica TaxID=2126181 RepID=A0A8H6S0G8_9AGAR|nr:uncharacterized protein MIND_01333100 [Mycena indigotica]KAF7290197.1 hypothetical protein MIND_01333100 [Mycena indigotica]
MFMFKKSLFLVCALVASGSLAAPSANLVATRQGPGCNVPGLVSAIQAVSEQAAVIRAIGDAEPDPLRRDIPNRARFNRIIRAALDAADAVSVDQFAEANAKAVQIDSLLNSIFSTLGDNDVSPQDLELNARVVQLTRQASACSV